MDPTVQVAMLSFSLKGDKNRVAQNIIYSVSPDNVLFPKKILLW
jgi:hypothetical protein